MRIVDRKTFLAMPRGTIYHQMQGWTTDSGDMEIKHDTLDSGDYQFASMTGVQIVDSARSDEWNDRMEQMENGASHPAAFDCIDHDGCYEDDQMYLIYERADVEALISKLQDSLDPEKMKEWG